MKQALCILVPAWLGLALLSAPPASAVKPTPLDPALIARQKEKLLLGEVKVPDGLEATLFAAPPAVNYPTFVAAAPDGTLYVSSDKNGSIGREPKRGRILRLRDLDGDGRADEVKLFVPNVDSPRGIVWDHDRLYLMHPPHLSAFIDRDGDGSADEEKVLVKNIAFTFKDRSADHTSNGVTLGIDGWLYLAIGDFGFLQAEGTDGRKLQLHGGGVVRVRPDGTGLEIYARGTRNIYGVAVDPLLNAFARDNTNDGGGWDTRLHHFTGLEHHGYPSLFKNFPEEIITPLADYGGGSGVGGIYLNEPGFPAGYGDALYTSDWGRSWVYRHQLRPNGATFRVDQKEFLGVPRVTDMTVDALSRLYVASWKGAVFNYAGENAGYLLRVVPRGYKPEPLPAFDKASAAELVKLLESPSQRRRLEAQRALLRRGLGEETVRGLTAQAKDKSRPLATRVAALFALKQGLHAKAVRILTDLAKDASIRAFAIRALTDRADELAGVPAPPILAALQDSDPRTRLEAVVAVARLGKAEHAPALTPLLTDADPVIAHTAVAALVTLKAADTCFAVVDKTDAPGVQRSSALRVLQALHEPAVVDKLLSRLERETSATRRQDLFAALCRLYQTEAVWTGGSWGTRPDTSGPYFHAVTWEQSPKIAAAIRTTLAHADGADAARFVAALNRNQVQMDDLLPIVLRVAAKDPAIVPVAVSQISHSSTIPAEALPLLTQVALADATPGAVRADAVSALVKAGEPATFRTVLSAMAHLSPKMGRDFDRGRDQFLESPKLTLAEEVFESEAVKLEPGTSVWADAALLALARQKKSSPPVLAAKKAITAGWSEPRRKAQILRAIAHLRDRSYSDKVLASVKDADAEVVKAAKAAAGALRLDLKAAGPTLETMKPEAVIAAVLKEKGDVALGELLFTQQGCAKCHTVRADQPPLGPFLGNIANTYKRHELAESVLLPSKTIAQGFTTNVFVLTNGKVLTGFVIQEAAEKVTLRDNEGKEIQVPVSEIEERSRSSLSVMPEGMVRNLTVREFASLLDYLESLAKSAPP